MAALSSRNGAHARAGIAESLVFRAAGKSGPLLERAVRAYASARMAFARGAYPGYGIRPLLAASTARLSELSCGREKWSYTRKHCLDVAYLSCVMANAALEHGIPGSEGLTPESCFAGGYLHDIGKAQLPFALVAKEYGAAFPMPRGKPLSELERGVLRSAHLRFGGEFVRLFPGVPQPVLDMVLLHHVTYNGLGTTHPSYPAGLSGLALPLHARIAKTADFLSAVGPRPYRGSHWVSTFEGALGYAVAVSGMELDPGTVACLLSARYGTGPGDSMALVLRLAHPGGQAAISDAGLVRSYVLGTVMADREFGAVLARRAGGAAHAQREGVRQCALGLGLPAAMIDSWLGITRI